MAERNDKGQFVAGSGSANPGGRCRDLVLTDDRGRELTADDFLAANEMMVFRNLTEIVRNKKASAAARVAASRTLLEYGRGKPGTQIKVSAEETGEVHTFDIEAIPTEFLTKLLEYTSSRKAA